MASPTAARWHSRLPASLEASSYGFCNFLNGASSTAFPVPSAMAEALASSMEIDLPARAQPLQKVHVRDNTLYMVCQ